MKRKFFNFVLIFSLCVSAASGVWLLVDSNTAHDEFAQQIVIETDEQQTVKNFEFESLNLKPGESCKYTIQLVCRAEGEYQISVVFCDKGGTLKNFVDVTVLLDGKKLASGEMSEIFGNDNIVTKSNLTAEDASELSIIYEMPPTVGNEAQGATADFDVTVTIGGE